MTQLSSVEIHGSSEKRLNETRVIYADSESSRISEGRKFLPTWYFTYHIGQAIPSEQVVSLIQDPSRRLERFSSRKKNISPRHQHLRNKNKVNEVNHHRQKSIYISNVFIITKKYYTQSYWYNEPTFKHIWLNSTIDWGYFWHYNDRPLIMNDCYQWISNGVNQSHLK